MGFSGSLVMGKDLIQGLCPWAPVTRTGMTLTLCLRLLLKGVPTVSKTDDTVSRETIFMRARHYPDPRHPRPQSPGAGIWRDALELT
jgi:hypothetical protein